MENPTHRALRPGDTVKLQGVERQVIAVDYVNQRVKLKPLPPKPKNGTDLHALEAAEDKRKRRRERAGGASS